jgi:hypothetical protein
MLCLLRTWHLWLSYTAAGISLLVMMMVKGFVVFCSVDDDDEMERLVDVNILYFIVQGHQKAKQN